MKKTIAFLLVLAMGTTLFGETLTVTSNADSGDGTLRALLAAASADDVVEIPANMTITLSTPITMPTKSVTIRGNGETSIVSGGNATHLFYFPADTVPYYHFDKLVLEKGYRSGGSAGFVLENYLYSKIVMTDCIVRDMHVDPMPVDAAWKTYYRSQRGVFITKGTERTSFYATNTTFTGMTGGSVIAGQDNNWGRNFKEFVLSNCRVVKNGKLGDECYAAMQVSVIPGNLNLIDKCVFADNVTSNGAAVAYYDNLGFANDSGYHFRDCIISNNTTSSGGGMFWLSAGRHRVENSIICDNKAKHNGIVYFGSGGYGIEFHNCLMTRNETTMAAADGYDHKGFFGFVQSGGSSKYAEKLLLSNCVFRANHTRSVALAGVFDSKGVRQRYVDTLFEDNIVWGDKLFEGATNYFTRCAFVGNVEEKDSKRNVVNSLFSATKQYFDSCLIYSNYFQKTYSIVGTGAELCGCTIVSNSSYYARGLSLNANSVVVNTVAVGNMKANSTTKSTDAKWDDGVVPAMTNCYFETATAAFEDQKVVTGKSAADLLIDCTLTTNDSKTVFLDGSRMPYLAHARKSLLRHAGVAYSALGPRDVRGGRRYETPDIGCYERPQDGFVIIVQ